MIAVCLLRRVLVALLILEALPGSVPLAFSQNAPQQPNGTAQSVDLGATDKSFSASTAGKFTSANIQVGGRTQEILPGDKVTAAELIAIQQALSPAGQSIILNDNGAAIQGVFQTSSLNFPLANFNLPANVTAIQNFTSATPNFQILGDFNNSGVFIATANTSGITAHISATNIFNNPGALITSVLPANLASAGNLAQQVSLALTATGQIHNAGTISSSGNLSLAASSIVNAATAQSQASILANGALNMLTSTGQLRNEGLISAIGNVNIDTVRPTDILIQNMQGRIESLTGSVAVRSAIFSGSENTIFNGGDIVARELNIFGGNGTVNLSVENLKAALNLVAGEAHVSADVDNLLLGNICVSGDPTFYNTAGSITIAGNLIFPGVPLAIVAAGDILTAPGAGIISTASSSSNGAQLTLIAGAKFTTTGPGSVLPPGAGDTTSTLSIAGASATGGSIDLNTSAPITTLSSASTSGGGSGGDLMLLAFAGTTPGSGKITVPAATTITSGGSGTGSNGKVTVFSSSSGGGAGLTLGGINTTGGAFGSGSITIGTVKINITGSVDVLNGTVNPSGISAGGPANSSTSFGALSVNGAAITILNGSGVLTMPALSTAGGAVSITSQGIKLNGTLDTSNFAGHNGGAVALNSGANIDAMDIITTGSAAAGVSGTITLNAAGTVTTGNLVVTPLSTSAGNNITITANGAISIGNVTHLGLDYRGPALLKITGGNTVTSGAIDFSGAVQITGAGQTQTGNISTHSQGDRSVTLASTAGGVSTGTIKISSSATTDVNDLNITAATNVVLGNIDTGGSGTIYQSSGDVNVSAGGNITTGSITTTSLAGTAGGVTLTSGKAGLGFVSTGALATRGNGAGFNSGTITFSATDSATVSGAINTTGQVQANSGAVLITAGTGIAVTGDIVTSSTVNRKSGVVTLSSTNGNIAVANIDTHNDASTPINGFYPTAGDITLSTGIGNITLDSLNSSGQNNAFGGHIQLTFGSGSMVAQRTINASAANNFAGRVLITGGAGAGSTINSAGSAFDLAVNTSSGGVNVDAGSVRISLGSNLTVNGGISSNASNQARSGFISINSSALTISGALNSSSANTRGGDILLSAGTTANIQAINSSGTEGGKVIIASGVSAFGDLIATVINTTGTSGNAGSAVFLSRSGVTLGTVTSTSAGGNGGNVTLTAGSSGVFGIITLGTVNTTGTNGGNVLITSLGTNGDIQNPASDIVTNATKSGGTAGSITVSTTGRVALHDLSAAGKGAGTQGGSILLSVGGAAVSLHNVDTSAADAAGNLYVLTFAGTPVSITGAVNQTGTTAGFMNVRVPDVILNSISASSTISFSSGPVLNFRPGGFLTGNAPAANVAIDTSGDSRLIVPLAILSGDANFAGITSNMTAGARSPVALFSTGNLTITNNLDASSPGSSAPTLAFISNVGSVSLGGVNATGDQGGKILIASPVSFQLTGGASLLAGSASGSTAGGAVQIFVAGGTVALSAPNNQSNNRIDVSGLIGGTIEILANGQIDDNEVDLLANGTSSGGRIAVASYNGFVNFFHAYNGVSNFNADIQSTATTNNGGSITIFGAQGITSQRDPGLCCGGLNNSIWSVNGGNTGAATGGSIQLTSSDGNISLVELGTISGVASGAGSVGGSFQSVARNGNITLTSMNFSGPTGGSIDSQSYSFNLPSGKNINANGTAGAGGKVSVSTVGLRSVGFGLLQLGSADNRTSNSISADGTSAGGSLTFLSSGVLADYEVQLRAATVNGTGGTVTVKTFASDMQFYQEFAGGAQRNPSIVVDSTNGNGGAITLNSGAQMASFVDTGNTGGVFTPVMSAQGKVLGGNINITAISALNLMRFADINAAASVPAGTGGSVTISSLQSFIPSVHAAPDGGTITVTSSSGGIRTQSGAAVVAADTVVFTATGNGAIDLHSSVTGTTSVQMSVFGGATYGDITRSSANATIAAPSVTLLSSSGSIGIASTPILVSGSKITANAGFPGESVYLQNTGGAPVSLQSSTAGSVFQMASPNPVTISQPITAPTISISTTAGNSSITLDANLNATTSATVSANGSGNINWNSGSITAPSVLLSSGSGDIGGSSTRLLTNTGSLSATTNGGTIMISNTGALQLQASSGSGTFDLTNDQNITISGALSTNKLSLAVTGANGSITANAAVTGLTSATLTAKGAGTITTTGTNTISSADLILNTAFADIGTVGLPVLTAAAALTFNTTGSAYLSNTGAISLHGSTNFLDLSLDSSDSINVNGALSGRSVQLQTSANNGSVKVGANITVSQSAKLTANGNGIIASDGGRINANSITLSSTSGDLGESPADRLLLATSTLSMSTASPGSIFVDNNGPVTLGAYPNVANFYFSNNSSITLSGSISSPVISISTTAGSGGINISAPISGNSVTIATNGFGAISGASKITANTLTLNSDNGAIGNVIVPLSIDAGKLSVSTTGDVYIDDAVSLGLQSVSCRDLTLTIAGSLTTSAPVVSTGRVSFNASAIVNGATINAGGPISFQSAGDVTNNAAVSAAGAFSLNAKGAVTNTDKITATGTIDVQTTGNVSNTGTLSAKGSTSIHSTSGAISNDGSMSGAGVNIIAMNDITNTSGSITSTGALTLQTGKGDITSGGTINAAGQLSIQSSGIFHNSGDLSSNGTGSVSSTGNLSNSGKLTISGQLSLQAINGNIINSGTIASSGAGLVLQPLATISNDGSITAAGQINVQTTGQLSVNGIGTLSASSLTLSATNGAISIAQDSITGSLNGTAGNGSLTINSNKGPLTLNNLSSTGGDIACSTLAGGLSVLGNALVQATGNVTLSGHSGVNLGAGVGIVTVRAGALTPGANFSAVLEPGDISSSGAISISSTTGDILLLNATTLTSNGGNISLSSAGNITANGAGNVLSCYGADILMYANGSIQLPAGTTTTFNVTARYLPGNNTIVIDGQSVRDYTGGGIAIYVNSPGTNLQTELDNARLNRLAAGSAIVSPSVVLNNTSVAIPDAGGTISITATGAGKVGIVNSNFTNPSGIILIDPPGDQIDLNNVFITTVAPALVTPLPPPPPAPPAPPAPAAAITPAPAPPAVPAIITIANESVQTSNGEAKQQATSSKTVLQTDTLDVPIVVPAHNERSCTAPAELGMTADDSSGELVFISNSCQGVFLDSKQGALALADQDTALSSDAEGSINLKSGKLVILENKKDMSISTKYGAVTIPADSAVRIDSDKRGVVRIAALAGDTVLQLRNGEGDLVSVSAAKGEEIVVSDSSASDEELIPTDGVDRIALSGSIVVSGKAAARKNKFDVHQMIVKEALLSCSSTCLPNAFRKKVSKLAPQAPSGSQSNFRPIAYSQLAAAEPPLMLRPIGSAVVAHFGSAKLAVNKANEPHLLSGQVLVSCSKRTDFIAGQAKIQLAAGSISELAMDADSLVVRVLCDTSATGATVTYDNQRAVKLSVGQQVIIAPGMKIKQDQTPQRRTYAVRLKNARASFSEFSMPFVLQTDPVLSALRKLRSTAAHHIHDRVMKASVCLSVVTMAHGSFSPSRISPNE